MRPLRLCAFLALALFAAPAAGAAPVDLDIGPDIGKSGEAWFSEDHAVPVITFVFSLPAGSAYDPQGKAGLAQFAAAMLGEGAGNLNAAAFHDALAAHGIRLSARADRDDLVVTLTTPSGDAAEAMRLVASALSHPRFDADALARVRARLLEDLRQGARDPARMANWAFMRAFFNGHPYGHPAGGDAAGLAAVGPEDLRAFIRGHWVRGGLKIAVSGDIAADKLAALLEPVAASLPPTKLPALPPVGRLGQPGVHMVAMNAREPAMEFGLPGIMQSDPDFVAALLACRIAGGGASSRLSAAAGLQGLHDISTTLVPMRVASVMVGRLAGPASVLRQAPAAVKAALADFAASGPTAGELADAKTYLTGAFPLDFASNAGAAARLGAFQREGLGIDDVSGYNDRIDAVTIADVRRVAKRLFDPTRLTVVIAGALTGRPADNKTP